MYENSKRNQYVQFFIDKKYITAIVWNKKQVDFEWWVNFIYLRNISVKFILLISTWDKNLLRLQRPAYLEPSRTTKMEFFCDS